ncbi:MAG: nucleotide pyrophosphohydrolase [Candidatus Pacebacteria bacterium]|nr:nucleotide pyrophosphohydrolase [Candidatus Paceibacterota bacterium]MCF7863077.1 nucleotide pyrophosphohydrolase [Candidatus Paceibacterota bacterium]
MKKYQTEVKKYLKERDWDNLRPADIAKSISIEASELLELFQWTNQELEEVKKDKEQIEKIKKELADVLIYCFNMGVLLNFDMGKIFLNKLEKVKEKYPAHLFKNRDKKVYTDSKSIYWKIKKEHRKKGY